MVQQDSGDRRPGVIHIIRIFGGTVEKHHFPSGFGSRVLEKDDSKFEEGHVTDR
jgi:hypothetical protein